MSHSGPLTMAQKRMLAMRAETANAAQSPGSPHMPLLPAVYDDSLSTSTSPHLTAHKQPLVSFGDIEMHDVSASASNAASPPSTYSHLRPQAIFSAAAKPFVPPGVAHSATVTTTAPMTALARRLPPHRTMQTQPSTAAPVASVRTIKSEPSVSPVLTEHNAAVSPAPRAGPHSKLGPHARKTEASSQPKASTTDENDHLKNGQSESDVKPEPAENESVPVSRPVSIKRSYTSSFAAPTELPTPVALNNITHRFGRDNWLPVLLRMDDPEKGRQLIRAVADHLRASVEGTNMTATTPNTDSKEILVEFETGQCLPAAVSSETTIKEMVKDCASVIGKHESDISIVLKVGSKGHANNYQASEEL